MTSLLVLLPVSLLLLGIAVATLAWASRHGQFDDLDAAAIDALTDDPTPGSHAEQAGAGAGADAKAKAD